MKALRPGKKWVLAAVGFASAYVLFISGCLLMDFEPITVGQLRGTDDIIEILMCSSDGYDQWHRYKPTNLKVWSRVNDPNKIVPIMTAIRKIEITGDLWSLTGEYQICFKDRDGNIGCMAIKMECDPKVVYGAYFMDESGELYEALEDAGLAPSCEELQEGESVKYPKPR
jgi:hypothetical protein